MFASTEEGFKLSPQAATALCAFASTDQTRPHLAAINFEPAIGTAVATDGHTMAIAKNCGSHNAPDFLVQATALERAAKLAKGKGAYLLVRYPIAPASNVVPLVAVSAAAVANDASCVVTIEAIDASGRTLGSISCPAVDARFPPWQQALPPADREPSAAVVGLNVTYMARLGLVAKAASIDSSASRSSVAPPAKLNMGGPLDPQLFTFEPDHGQSKWSVVLMPARI